MSGTIYTLVYDDGSQSPRLLAASGTAESLLMVLKERRDRGLDAPFGATISAVTAFDATIRNVRLTSTHGPTFAALFSQDENAARLFAATLVDIAVNTQATMFYYEERPGTPRYQINVVRIGETYAEFLISPKEIKKKFEVKRR